MPEPAERITESIAQNTSRRGFLARVSKTLFAASAAGTVGAVLKSGDVEANHLCGHTFTTGSCPHPAGKPRVDKSGYPLRSSDGKPVDNLGRVVNSSGVPVDSSGDPLRDADGRALPPAPRTKICTEAGKRFGINAQNNGSWYRCCGGQVRKLMDCCAHTSRRINGDAAVTGYCFGGRKVFCVMYYDTGTRC